jgi:hypothetical protein
MVGVLAAVAYCMALSDADINGNCKNPPPVPEENACVKLSMVLKYCRKMPVKVSTYLWSYSTGAAGKRGALGGISAKERSKGSVIDDRPV